jgi:hypothetical protein
MISISRPFLEKFLLSFIEAHLPAGAQGLSRQRIREQRLRAAKQALFGEGTNHKHFNDSEALLYMAEQYLRDRYINLRTGRRIKMGKSRSVRALAKTASALVFGNSTASTVQRLRSRFRGTKKEELLNIARYADDVDDTIEYQVLERICELLRPYGVEMDLTAAGRSSGYQPRKKTRVVGRL